MSRADFRRHAFWHRFDDRALHLYYYYRLTLATYGHIIQYAEYRRINIAFDMPMRRRQLRSAADS